jgi:hypothetical protein
MLAFLTPHLARRVILVSTLAASLALGTGLAREGGVFQACAQPKTPQFYTVLLVDTSSSMHANDSADRRVVAGKFFVSLMAENEHVAVISFDDGAHRLQSFTEGKTQGSRGDLDKALDKTGNASIPVPVGNPTDLLAGLNEVETVLAPLDLTGLNRAAVVILTDGAPWPSKFGPCDGVPDVAPEPYGADIETIAERIGQRANIFPIGLFNPQVDPSDPCLAPDRGLMERIADVGNGAFVEAATADRIVDAYVEVLVRTHNFRSKEIEQKPPVHFQVPPQTKNLFVVAEGKDVRLQLRVAGQSIEGIQSRIDDLAVIRVLAPPSGEWTVEEATGKEVAIKALLVELDYTAQLTEPQAGASFAEGQAISLRSELKILVGGSIDGPLLDQEVIEQTRVSVGVERDDHTPESDVSLSREERSNALTGEYTPPLPGRYCFTPQIAGIPRAGERVCVDVTPPTRTPTVTPPPSPEPGAHDDDGDFIGFLFFFLAVVSIVAVLLLYWAYVRIRRQRPGPLSGELTLPNGRPAYLEELGRQRATLGGPGSDIEVEGVTGEVAQFFTARRERVDAVMIAPTGGYSVHVVPADRRQQHEKLGLGFFPAIGTASELPRDALIVVAQEETEVARIRWRRIDY